MERKKCPYCGEEIAASAKKCRFCGEWLEKPTQPRPTAAPASQQPMPPQPVIQQPAPQQPAIQQPVPQQYEFQETEPQEGAKTGFFQTYFIDSLLRPYADFSGVSSRKEFWLTYLAVCIISAGVTGLTLLVMGLAGMTGIIIGSAIAAIFGLGLLIPNLAISVRRLRDAGMSPWLILIILIPAIGAIALIVMFCRPTQYQHEDKNSSFDIVDIIVTALCAILLIAGPIVGTTNMISALAGGSSYALGDYTESEDIFDSVVDVEYADVEEPQSGNSSSGASLIDLMYDTDYVRADNATFTELFIFDNYDKMAAESGYTNQYLTATGSIDGKNVTMHCWLTEDGEIHGRYRHENGTALDANGYLKSDGSLYIQLGHGSEKSDWNLSPVNSELSDAYRYEGYWGRKQKPSYLVFSEVE